MQDRRVVTRRFEREDRSGVRRFWEIELEQTRMSTRHGQVGRGLVNGKRREFETRDAALREAGLRMRKRLDQGWREIAGPLPCPARNGELETAIVDALVGPNPSDDAWSVYADWLQARGEPFGEWLGCSIAGALPDPDPQARWLWSSELLWLADGQEFESIAHLELRHGFVVRATIIPEPASLTVAPARLLAALVASPAASLLHRLKIGPIGEALVGALLGHRHSFVLEHLRELTLGEFVYPDQTEISWVEIGDLAQVLKACPSLRTLHVRGAAIRCEAAIDHPRLASLTLETCGLGGQVVEALACASLPSLVRLELWFGQPRYGPCATIEQLGPIFAADTLPSVRELGLVNCEFTDAIVLALVDSPRLATIDRLDLSRGTLGEAGGRAILDHVGQFRHLRSLDLDGNYVPTELAQALAAALVGVVRIGEQIDPAIGRNEGPGQRRGGGPGYYAAVGE